MLLEKFTLNNEKLENILDNFNILAHGCSVRVQLIDKNGLFERENVFIYITSGQDITETGILEIAWSTTVLDKSSYDFMKYFNKVNLLISVYLNRELNNLSNKKSALPLSIDIILDKVHLRNHTEINISFQDINALYNDLEIVLSNYQSRKNLYERKW